MKKAPSYELTTVCPFCSALHEMATEIHSDGEPPRSMQTGDITLCIQCGEWCECEGDHLVIPSDESYEHIAASKECKAIRESWLLTKARAE